MTDDQLDPAIILARVQNSTEFDDIHGTQQRTTAYGDGLSRTTVEVWERPPDRSRIEVQSMEVLNEFDEEPSIASITDEFDEAHLMILQGHKLWLYNRETNTYRVYDIDDPEEMAGPVTNDSLINSISEPGFELSYESTDRIAGYDTHVLFCRPTANAEPFYRQFEHIRLWIEPEHWALLGSEAAFQRGDEAVLTGTKTFTELDFDIDLDESVFSFEPLEGAMLVEE